MRTDPEEFIEEFFQLRPSCIVPLEPADFIKISFILVDVYSRYVEPDASLRDQAYSFSQFLPLVERKLVGWAGQSHEAAEVKSQGYAVLENAAIPIVGEGESEPKDTYVDQHVASAKASIDQGSRLGVVNRARAAFMGTIARSARFEQVTLSQEVCGHESTAGVARLRKLFIPRYSY